MRAVLVLMLIVTATPVEKVFQSFHLYDTTHRKVAAAGCIRLCRRNDQEMAMSSQGRAAGLLSPAFTQFLRKY